MIFACPLQCGKTMLHGFCRWKNSICSWVSHRRHNISSIVLPKLSRVTVGFHILLFSYAALHYPAKRLRRESDITALPPFFRRKVGPKNLKQKNSLSGSEWDLALPEFLPAGSILQQKKPICQYRSSPWAVLSIRLPLYRISMCGKRIVTRQKTAAQTFSENWKSACAADKLPL